MLFLIIWLGCAFLTGYIAKEKHRDYAEGFLLGFFLGLIGLIIECCLPTKGKKHNALLPDWKPDPTGRHQLRYWDGNNWSEHVSDAGIVDKDPF